MEDFGVTSPSFHLGGDEHSSFAAWFQKQSTPPPLTYLITIYSIVGFDFIERKPSRRMITIAVNILLRCFIVELINIFELWHLHPPVLERRATEI